MTTPFVNPEDVLVADLPIMSKAKMALYAGSLVNTCNEEIGALDVLPAGMFPHYVEGPSPEIMAMTMQHTLALLQGQ